jgi:hypothetical protein
MRRSAVPALQLVSPWVCAADSTPSPPAPDSASSEPVTAIVRSGGGGRSFRNANPIEVRGRTVSLT